MQNFSKFDVTNMMVERQFIDRQYFSVEDVSEAWDWVHAATLPTDGGYDDGDGRRYESALIRTYGTWADSLELEREFK